jgi:heptaprenyl diphosphate synthase
MKFAIKKSTFIFLLIILSLVFYIGESALSPLVPTISAARLGLSYIFILYALYSLGPKAALTVVLFKSILGPLLSGTPTSIVFSLFASSLSFITMFLVKKHSRNKIGLIGVSVCGSFMHNVGLILFATIITNNISVLSYFPTLGAISAVCGIITGIAATGLLKITQNIYLK